MTDSPNKLPATITNPGQPPQGKTWPLWIFCLILLAGLIGVGLWSWQQSQSHQQLQQSLSHITDQNRQLEQRLSQGSNDHSGRLQGLEGTLREQQQRLSEQQRQIDHNARQLLDAGNRTRTDWLLAEAEYLLRIANQRLLIEQDIRGALAALNAADQVLRETDDVGAYPVREQLAREIMALRTVTDVDRTGLYLQLEAARETVTQLTDQAVIGGGQPAPDSDQNAGESAPDTEPGTAARAWQRITDSLGQMVSIRRLDEPVKPLLSPDQSAWARLNLQLMLEQAELAVLRGHEDLYRQALDKAVISLETWFDNTDNRVAALRDTLAGLSDREVNPELPDISESLALLKGRIAGRHGNGGAKDQSDGSSGGSANGEDDPS